MTQRLIIQGNKVYLLDMTAMGRMLRELMPMLIQPPPSERIQFRAFYDHLPAIKVPSAILMTSICDDYDPWKFVYLFPLGKRAYVRRK